jgi:hypothetical protein
MTRTSLASISSLRLTRFETAIPKSSGFQRFPPQAPTSAGSAARDRDSIETRLNTQPPGDAFFQKKQGFCRLPAALKQVRIGRRAMVVSNLVRENDFLDARPIPRQASGS